MHFRCPQFIEDVAYLIIEARKAPKYLGILNTCYSELGILKNLSIRHYSITNGDVESELWGSLGSWTINLDTKIASIAFRLFDIFGSPEFVGIQTIRGSR
jgi:hypothetical protein